MASSGGGLWSDGDNIVTVTKYSDVYLPVPVGKIGGKIRGIDRHCKRGMNCHSDIIGWYDRAGPVSNWLEF